MTRHIKADPARIRELAAEGYSQSTIADLIGVSRERIRQICDRDGIETLRGGKNYDAREALADLAGAKMSLTEAARLAGISAGAASVIIRELGIEKPKARTLADDYRECAEAGLTLTQTAKKLGKSLQAVWSECRRQGITFSARHKAVSPRKRWSAEEVEAAIARLRSGEPRSSVAASFGVSPTALTMRISAYCKRVTQ